MIRHEGPDIMARVDIARTVMDTYIKTGEVGSDITRAQQDGSLKELALQDWRELEAMGRQEPVDEFSRKRYFALQNRLEASMRTMFPDDLEKFNEITSKEIGE